MDDEEDIPAMMREFGVDITISGVTVKGLVDKVDKELLQAGSTYMVGKSISVKIHTGTLPGLAREAAVIVDGVAYKVRDIAQIGDGKITQFFCALEVS